jgi:hypothetical protein
MERVRAVGCALASARALGGHLLGGFLDGRGDGVSRLSGSLGPLLPNLQGGLDGALRLLHGGVGHLLNRPYGRIRSPLDGLQGALDDLLCCLLGLLDHARRGAMGIEGGGVGTFCALMLQDETRQVGAESVDGLTQPFKVPTCLETVQKTSRFIRKASTLRDVLRDSLTSLDGDAQR